MTVRAPRLRGRGLEQPSRANGVNLPSGLIPELCREAGIPHEITPNGKTWVVVWGVALLVAMQGGWRTRTRRGERDARLEVLRWFVERPELCAALEALWRLGNHRALQEQAATLWNARAGTPAPAPSLPPHPRLPGA